MRKLYTALFTIICLSAELVGLAYASAEGIVNGGFETGTLAGWTSSLPVVLTSQKAHSGFFALEIYQISLTQTFAPPILPADDLSVWVCRIDNDPNEAFFVLNAIITYGDGSQVTISKSAVLPPQVDEWYNYVYQVDKTKAITKITFCIPQFGPTLLLDDISLLDDPLPPMAIPEVSLGAILATAVMTVAFGVYVMKPRLRRKPHVSTLANS